ncbi:MAG: hypothetical protein M3071_12155 [Actinomycetota bacterium]|nr:hypothetical protein [Actinomycetota bacterium]
MTTLWGLSPLVLTVVYATYAFGVLTTLLLTVQGWQPVSPSGPLARRCSTFTPAAIRKPSR